MTTYDKIELPPLPEWSKMDNLGGLVPSEIRQALAVYARAAIEADRKRLVMEYNRLDKEWADLRKAQIEADRNRRGEPVYCSHPKCLTSAGCSGSCSKDAPQPAEPGATDWHQIADERAAEIVRLMGLLDEWKQRGEPVKVELSDQQILQLMLGFGTHVDGDTTATFTGAELLAGCRALLARYGARP